jgi:hypothetical protein
VCPGLEIIMVFGSAVVAPEKVYCRITQNWLCLIWYIYLPETALKPLAFNFSKTSSHSSGTGKR